MEGRTLTQEKLIGNKPPERKDLLGTAARNRADERVAVQGDGGRFARFWRKTTGESLRVRHKVGLIIFALVFLFVFYVVLDANKYEMQVQVIEGEGKVGVNPTTESLDFGDMSRGTTAVRRVSIENGTGIPMYVMAIMTGKASDLVDVEPNFFRLQPNTQERIEFSLYMPASAEIGNTYRGRVFLFKIPTF